MVVKIIRGANKESERMFECEDIDITRTFEGSVAHKQGIEPLGVKVQLSPSGRILRLPQDGDVIYITNDAGDTINTIRWDPKATGVLKETAGVGEAVAT